MSFENKFQLKEDSSKLNDLNGVEFESVLENKEIVGRDEQDIEKTEAALSEYCAQHDNPIKIWKSGSKIEKEPQLDSSLLTEKISQPVKDALQSTLVKMVDFIHAPIFTDSFHQDHDARRVWERANIVKDKKLNRYYQRNRLTVTNWSVFQSLDYFLQYNSQELPQDIVQRVNNVIIATGVNSPETDRSLIPNEITYNKKLSDEEKVALMTKIETVFKALIRIISEKNKK